MSWIWDATDETNRMKSDPYADIRAQRATIAAKDAEIAKLREALSKVSGYDRNFYDNGRPGYEEIARAALSSTEGTEG
jgi:hypothetical protein